MRLAIAFVALSACGDSHPGPDGPAGTPGGGEGEGEGSGEGGDDGEGEGEGEGDTPCPEGGARSEGKCPTTTDTGLPSRCVAGAPWAPGTRAFREASADWGLDDLAVTGVRLSVTDLDGDHRPDVIVRAGERPFVLRNVPGGFEDVTDTAGLSVVGGGPLASGDVDGDGDVDVYVADTVHDVAAAQRWSEVFLNDGGGTFSPGPSDNPARYEGRRAVPAGATLADVDLDGVLDLWVTHNMAGGSNQALQDDLFLGEGDGVFADATFRVGVATHDWGVASLNRARGHSWAWSSAACDLNGDGWPELLASSYGRMANHLWQAQGDPADGSVRFENRSLASGYAWDDRMDWTDDLSAQCHCKDAPADPECELAPDPDPQVCASLRAAFGENYRWDHATGREPFRMGGNSGATVCADMDNDGDIDLVTGEIRHGDVGSCSDPAELLLNTGEADVRFERPGNDSTGLDRGWPARNFDEGAMTLAVLDFDNDGWQDVYFGLSDYNDNQGRLFHQRAPGRFQPVPVDDMFEHLRSHGVAAADFDLDGDVDLMVGHSRMRCGGQCYDTSRVRAFENIVGQGSNWVRLRPQGDAGHPENPTNPSAIGARVRVTTPDGVTRTQEVDGGHGHFNTQKDLTLHFGLGDQCTATVEIRWPNRALTVRELTVQSGYSYVVPQHGPPRVLNGDAG